MAEEFGLDIMLRKVAENHGINLETIEDLAGKERAEERVEQYESERRREDATALRISLALFYYGQRDNAETNRAGRAIEFATYHVSKAGAVALLYNRLLSAQLRHIAAPSFAREARRPPGRNSQGGRRLMKKACLVALHAAETYVRLTNSDKAAEACFGLFLKYVDTIQIDPAQTRRALRNIRDNSSELKPKVEAYCRRADIQLPP